MSELSREDYESVERAGLELHARGWRKAFSLNEMLEAYEQLVSKVEEGYDEVIDEYANDLSCRDWWRSPGRSSPTACAGAVQQNWRLWSTGLGRQPLTMPDAR